MSDGGDEFMARCFTGMIETYPGYWDDVTECWREHNEYQRPPWWQRLLPMRRKDEIDFYWEARRCIDGVIAKQESLWRLADDKCQRWVASKREGSGS